MSKRVKTTLCGLVIVVFGYIGGNTALMMTGFKSVVEAQSYELERQTEDE